MYRYDILVNLCHHQKLDVRPKGKVIPSVGDQNCDGPSPAPLRPLGSQAVGNIPLLSSMLKATQPTNQPNHRTHLGCILKIPCKF